MNNWEQNSPFPDRDPNQTFSVEDVNMKKRMMTSFLFSRIISREHQSALLLIIFAHCGAVEHFDEIVNQTGIFQLHISSAWVTRHCEGKEEKGEMKDVKEGRKQQRKRRWRTRLSY
jgi:hypothetical protein